MKFLKKIYKWIPFFLLFIPFRLLSMIPNHKNILLFGTGTGIYHDNSKYLFEYFLEHREKDFKEYKAYWVAKNNKTYKKLLIKGYPVVKNNSFKHLYLSTNAKAYFITAELFDVFWFINKTTKLIQLWHGTPIKCIGYDYYMDVKNIMFKKKFFTKNYSYNRFDYFIIENIKYKEIYKSAFKINEKKILGLGQARNDLFYNLSKDKKVSILKRLDLSIYDKVILYAPTFRKEFNDNIYLIEQLFSKENLDYIEKNNFCIILKLHPFLMKSNIVGFNHKNIINLSLYEDIQDLLIVSDAVITDISSLALDYLLYNENLYIYFPDKEKYLFDRKDLYELSYKELEKKSKKINLLSEITFDNELRRIDFKRESCKKCLEFILNEKI